MISSFTEFLALTVSSVVLMQGAVQSHENHGDCVYQDGKYMPYSQTFCNRYGNGVCWTHDEVEVQLSSKCDKYNKQVPKNCIKRQGKYYPDWTEKCVIYYKDHCFTDDNRRVFFGDNECTDLN